jgi:predicted amidohydrolase
MKRDCQSTTCPKGSKEIQDNFDKVGDYISKESFDLIVLPELFTTGYLFTSQDEMESFADRRPELYSLLTSRTSSLNGA